MCEEELWVKIHTVLEKKGREKEKEKEREKEWDGEVGWRGVRRERERHRRILIERDKRETNTPFSLTQKIISISSILCCNGVM